MSERMERTREDEVLACRFETRLFLASTSPSSFFLRTINKVEPPPTPHHHPVHLHTECFSSFQMCFVLVTPPPPPPLFSTLYVPEPTEVVPIVPPFFPPSFLVFLLFILRLSDGCEMEREKKAVKIARIYK